MTGIYADWIGDSISQYTGFIVTGVIVGLFQAVTSIIKTYFDRAVAKGVAAELAKKTAMIGAKVDAKTDAIKQSVDSVLKATEKQDPVLDKIDKQTNGEGPANQVLQELRELRVVVDAHAQLLAKIHGIGPDDTDVHKPVPPLLQKDL